jgi:hypothetical protein
MTNAAVGDVAGGGAVLSPSPAIWRLIQMDKSIATSLRNTPPTLAVVSKCIPFRGLQTSCAAASTHRGMSAGYQHRSNPTDTGTHLVILEAMPRERAFPSRDVPAPSESYPVANVRSDQPTPWIRRDGHATPPIRGRGQRVARVGMSGGAVAVAVERGYRGATRFRRQRELKRVSLAVG